MWGEQAWLLPKGAAAVDVEAADRVVELCTATPGSSKAAEAVAELLSLYTKPDPPDIGLIRQPKVGPSSCFKRVAKTCEEVCAILVSPCR